MLNVNTFIFRTNALGPGIRAVVWFQGCKGNCKGCISPEMKSFTQKNLYDSVELAELLLRQRDIQGITISGGEPFEQCTELRKLLKHVKEHSTLNTMVYSGFSIEQIESDKYKAECLKYIDILIDGKFEESLTKAMWRGSVNQRILSPTNLFKNNEIEEWCKNNESAIEFHISDGNLVAVGIPERGFIEDFKRRLKEKGIYLG